MPELSNCLSCFKYRNAQFPIGPDHDHNHGIVKVCETQRGAGEELLGDLRPKTFTTMRLVEQSDSGSTDEICRDSVVVAISGLVRLDRHGRPQASSGAYFGSGNPANVCTRLSPALLPTISQKRVDLITCILALAKFQRTKEALVALRVNGAITPTRHIIIQTDSMHLVTESPDKSFLSPDQSPSNFTEEAPFANADLWMELNEILHDLELEMSVHFCYATHLEKAESLALAAFASTGQL